jgi:Mg2+ and Co2+ transporter CorA
MKIELDIFVASIRAVSAQQRQLRGFLGDARAEREPQLLTMGSSFVLYALLDAVVDRYFPVVDMRVRLENPRTSFIKKSQRSASNTCTISARCCSAVAIHARRDRQATLAAGCHNASIRDYFAMCMTTCRINSSDRHHPRDH